MSIKNRSQTLEVAALREFDVVVIGGGIVGAGVAQDAASRGLSCLIVEKEDFASGTSSKTTKLIHGGLRYLEQLHFGLTRELCHERALLEQLAPHMVRDFSFILPISKDNPFFGIKAGLGLTLYDVLASGVTSSHRHTRLSQKEVLEYVPALISDKISGGLRFHDCITDDARLVLEVIKSACNEGALALNYLEATGFQVEDNKIRAVECRDRYSGNAIVVRCKTCVNATGVWSDSLAQKIDQSWKNKIAPAKGIHIIVPNSAFETNSTALFLPTNDKRYVFVVPWQRALMIGTTDTFYSGSLDTPLPMSDEIDYLLSVINQYSQKKLARTDIIAAWAGLRPLIGPGTDSGATAAPSSANAKLSTSNLSREHEIFEGPGGMITLIGGKLTNYRLMSNQVLAMVLAKLYSSESEQKAKQSRTKRLMLGGWTDKADFLTQTAAIAAHARKLSIEPAAVDHLIASYGKDAQTIVDLVEREPALNHRICPDFPPIMAEVAFSVIHEMAVSLEDMLFRRMRLGIVHQKQCLDAAPIVVALMQKLLGWDQSRTLLELEAVENTLKNHLQSFAGLPAAQGAPDA